MSTAILGKKLGMMQIFDDHGYRVPVTVVEAGPCLVVQKRTPAKHKYSAIQIGYEQVAGRKLSKPQLGVFGRADLSPLRYLREIRLAQDEVEAYKIGDAITVSIFTPGEKVDVTGTSKGKGYQGVVKRHHMKGNTKTRGTHEYRRHPGSIGMREQPGRVIKGKKLPGQMGNRRITTQNLTVFKVEEEKNLLYLHGCVPGATGGLVMVKKAAKFTPAKK
jgi:large subunit ribosomal protein L3